MTPLEGITQSGLNSIGVAAVSTVMAFTTAWFWNSRNAAVKKAEDIAKAHELVLNRLTELETKEKLSNQMMTPIVTAFQSILIKQLTHIDKPEMDELMAKLGPPNTLTAAEHDRLIEMLEHRSTDMTAVITPAERAAAKMLPLVIPMAAEEQANFAEAMEGKDMKLVTIISVTGGAEKRTPRRQSE